MNDIVEVAGRATIVVPGNDIVQIQTRPNETLGELLRRSEVHLAPDTEVRVNGVLATPDNFNQPIPADAKIVVTGKIAGAII